MKSKLFSNLLQQPYLRKTSVKDKYQQQFYRNNLNYSSSGFTLLEVLVAIVIVGILSAIIAPSWLAFVNTQQLNKANDTILAALQEAQRQAKKTKRSYSVSFRKNQDNDKIIEYAIYPTKKLDGEDIESNKINIWKPLGKELGINPEKFLVGTNLIDKNKGNGDSIKKIRSTSRTTKITETITFDHKGTLPRDSEMPLKIVLAIPNAQRQTQPSNKRRCVIVETLVGGIRTAKDDKCDTNSSWQ